MIQEKDSGGRSGRLLVILSGVAAAAGLLILLVCGVLSFDLPLATELFALCLAIEALCGVILYRKGRRVFAGLAAVVFVAFVVLSLVRLYVEHWTPWDGYHRHTIWELGHVH